MSSISTNYRNPIEFFLFRNGSKRMIAQIMRFSSESIYPIVHLDSIGKQVEKDLKKKFAKINAPFGRDR